MPVKAGYLLLTGGGLVFVWSGLRGKPVTNVFRDLIGGKNPATEAQTSNITGISPAVGVGTSSSGPAGTPLLGGGTINVYTNPISHVTGIINQRVDQGVDFTGHGPIFAIGNGQVIETNGGGWPGGPFMSYRLTDGPAAGKVVYVAEQIMPTVHPGDTVRAGQQIAVMSGYIEMGWADSSGHSPASQSADAGGISGANLPAGGTLIGRNFEMLLRALGAGGANNLNQSPGGRMPPGYPSSY